jgi:hypothetical protein
MLPRLRRFRRNLPQSPRGRHVLRADPAAIPRWWLPALVALIVAVLAAGALQAGGASTTTDQLATATQAGNQAAGTANDLASTIDAACKADTIPRQYASACTKARQVVAQPVPGPEGPVGAPGATGADGARRAYPAPSASLGWWVRPVRKGLRVHRGPRVRPVPQARMARPEPMGNRGPTGAPELTARPAPQARRGRLDVTPGPIATTPVPA